MKATNETIRRLDRRAALIGVDLKETGANKREFSMGERRVQYKVGGKGVVRVRVLVFKPVLGWQCDAEDVVNTERIEMLFARASGLGHS